MNTNNKSLIITAGAVLVAAFFMPWIQVFGSFSAWDIVFGDPGRLLKSEFRFVGVIIPIAGLLVIYGAAFSNGNYLVPKQLLFLLPVLTLIIIAVAVAVILDDKGARAKDFNIEGLIKILGFGFWLTLIASIILPALNSLPVSGTSFSNNQNIPAPALSDDQSAPQTVNQPQYTRPQVNINLPKVNWDDSLAKIKTFLRKYKIVLLSAVGLLIASLVVYQLFIKEDPVKDAKNLAKKYCGCSEELNKSNLASTQSYLKEFDGKKFKSRTEARNTLNTILQENQTRYNNCTQAVNVKYTERLADYNAEGGRNAYTFIQTYTSISSVCNNTSSSDIMALQSQVDEKIRAVIDPEPDIEKIKADLIGQEVVGWRFAYLNEYRTARILNTSKSNDRIEYQVKFDLVDNTTNSEHDCEVMVVYLQSEAGWYLTSVNLNYIIYTYTFYPDRFVQITPYQNCKWNADNSYNMSWKTSDWEYAGETITGPDKGPTTLPYSTSYYVKSLEGREIKVKFTYRPK